MAKPKNHDEYIEAAAEFAVPILNRIRKAVHKACPQVEESLKWGMPHFDYHGILVSMAAFKRHVSLNFWRGKELEDPLEMLQGVSRMQMRSVRLEKLSELPTQKVLVQYIQEAKRLNEAAKDEPKKTTKKKAGKRKAAAARKLTVPADLKAALARSRPAKKTFENFSYTNKKEYVEWIEDAKREATREKRIQTALEWMAAGKPRNWKYMKEWQ